MQVFFYIPSKYVFIMKTPKVNTVCDVVFVVALEIRPKSSSIALITFLLTVSFTLAVSQPSLLHTL